MTADLADYALRLKKLGFSVIPPRANGSKGPQSEPTPEDCTHPDCVEQRREAAAKGEKPYGWVHFQHAPADEATIRRWYTQGRTGVGFLTGTASHVGLIGHPVEMLELEGRAVADGILDRLVDACAAAGITHVLRRLREGWEERTPSGGIHWYYGCPEVEGNVKLAKTANGQDLIETRGTGGFTIVAPSHGTVHPSGEPWQLVAGGPETCPVVTPDERRKLFGVCRTFNANTRLEAKQDERFDDLAERDPVSEFLAASPERSESWIDAVIADYNNRTSWAEVLAGHFEHRYDKGSVGYWHFVGAENDTSATTNKKGTDTLIVFSGTANGSGWDIWEGTGKAPSYDKFSARLVIERGGGTVTTDDRVAFARRLREAGYGPQDKPSSSTTSSTTPGEPAASSRTVSGAAWILDEPDDIPAIWGERDDVLWSRGETLMLVGPPGVGKTTIGQQLVLALVGIRPAELLGFPVAPLGAGEKVLYLAGDRPRQAARSFKRMVNEEHRVTLDEKLVVWRGPLPFDITKDPEKLAQFCLERGATVVVIDSLKDVARKFTDDESGTAINSALQETLVAGIEVVVLHHQRKAVGENKKPKTLADVYGSVWITAGAGSVLLVWGDPGDSCVELTHLKQPAADVGPISVIHDHRTGTTEPEGRFDLLHFMRQRSNGVTASDVAKARFNTSEPKSNQVEKARRNLNEALNRGLIRQLGGPKFGGTGGSRGAVYVLDDPLSEYFCKQNGTPTLAPTHTHAHPHEHPRTPTESDESTNGTPTGGTHETPLYRGGRFVEDSEPEDGAA